MKYSIILFSFSFSMHAMVPFKDNAIPFNDMPQEIKAKVYESYGTPYRFGNDQKYDYALVNRAIYGYQFELPENEILHAPTTLNTLEVLSSVEDLIPLNFYDSYHEKESIKTLTPENRPSCFRLQCRTGIRNNCLLKIGDMLEKEHNMLQMFRESTNILNNNLLFDGANKNNVCAVVLNSKYDQHYNYHLAIFNIHKQTKMCNLNIRDTQENITSLMLHYYKNLIVTGIHNTLTNKHYFGMHTIAVNPPPLKPLPENMVEDEWMVSTIIKKELPLPVYQIRRLRDNMYLGVSENNRLTLIEIENNNEITINEKKVYVTNQDGTKTEDTFTHLAVDNCTDEFEQNSIEHDATSFVAINTAGELYWCSFKSNFYNQQRNITLRKMSDAIYQDVKNIWLKDNKIGLLIHSKNKNENVGTIITYTINFFHLPFIDNNAPNTQTS